MKPPSEETMQAVAAMEMILKLALSAAKGSNGGASTILLGTILLILDPKTKEDLNRIVHTIRAAILDWPLEDDPEIAASKFMDN